MLNVYCRDRPRAFRFLLSLLDLFIVVKFKNNPEAHQIRSQLFSRIYFTKSKTATTNIIQNTASTILDTSLNAYQYERSCLDLISLPLPAHLYASEDCSCSVKPIALLHLTVDYCTMPMPHAQKSGTGIWHQITYLLTKLVPQTNEFLVQI